MEVTIGVLLGFHKLSTENSDAEEDGEEESDVCVTNSVGSNSSTHYTAHSKQHTTHKAQRTVHSAQHTVHSKQYECYLFSLFLPVVSSVSHDIVVARVDRHVRRFIEGIGIGAQSRIE